MPYFTHGLIQRNMGKSWAAPPTKCKCLEHPARRHNPQDLLPAVAERWCDMGPSAYLLPTLLERQPLQCDTQFVGQTMPFDTLLLSLTLKTWRVGGHTMALTAPRSVKSQHIHRPRRGRAAQLFD